MADELPANDPTDTDSKSDPGPGWCGVGLVALGGMGGTMLRYGLGTMIGDVAGLPLGVFIINVTGALALGFLIEFLTMGGHDRGRRRVLRLLVGTGLLGGYTTYSLLAMDIAQLILDHRIASAVGYGVATILVGGIASWVGTLAARSCRRPS